MMTSTIRLRRICPGTYVTRNTTPVAHIEREEFGWRVAYGEYSGLWATKAECVTLLVSTAYYHESDHAFPIKITP